MKKLKKIKQLSSNKYELIIDDEKIKVYDDVLLELGIMRAQEISDEIYQKLIVSAKYYEAYNKVIKFINSKLRTEKEIRDELKTLENTTFHIEKLINKLKNEGYLNKERYIEAYINDKMLLSLEGPLKIKKSLINLGFEEKEFTVFFQKISTDEWAQRVKKLINKKIKTYHKLSNRMLKIKLKKDLQNMGYPSDFEYLLNDVEVNDEDALKKDYQKFYNKYARKYEGKELQIKLKQKLYTLGYDINQIEAIIKST